MINWDAKTIRHENDRMVINVRTGSSRMFDNFMTARMMRNPVEGMALYRRVLELLTELSTRADVGMLFNNVPYFEIIDPYPVYPRHSDRRIIVMYGVITNGSKQRRVIGDYRFVVCMDEEAEKVMDTVFDLERTIILLQEPLPIIPEKPKAKARR